jgi:hypothetical protein
MTAARIPPKSCAIYKAATLINKAGPHQLVELFASIDFGPTKKRQEKLNHAIDTDWLCSAPDGRIDITEKARAHFADLEPSDKPIGQITPARYRGDWRASTLDKKHIPNRRGPRADVPAWSVKPDGYSIKSVGGGAE